MDVELEREAKLNAAKIVSNILARTNSLEQMKQSRKLRASREVSCDVELYEGVSEMIFSITIRLLVKLCLKQPCKINWTKLGKV